MDRSRELQIAQALNEAIWLRDNVGSLTKYEIHNYIKELGSHRVFSSRQIEAIVNGTVSYGTISKLINKNDKTGGTLNVGTLDILRNILYSRADSSTDFSLVASAVGQGTSQGMVARLTGISQGTISKKIGGVK